MCLAVRGSEPLTGNVGVYLGGAQARMAEHFLHRTEVCAAVE